MIKKMPLLLLLSSLAPHLSLADGAEYIMTQSLNTPSSIQSFFNTAFPQLADPNCVKNVMFDSRVQSKIAIGKFISHVEIQFRLRSEFRSDYSHQNFLWMDIEFSSVPDGPFTDGVQTWCDI